MVHVITLPNGRQCSVGTYAKAWRTVIAMKPNRHQHVSGFTHGAEPAWSVLAAMRGGLSERINRHIPGYGVGRKWANDYQVRLWRDARRLQDIANRIRVYQFETEEARSRFAHLLSDRSDI